MKSEPLVRQLKRVPQVQSMVTGRMGAGSILMWILLTYRISPPKTSCTYFLCLKVLFLNAESITSPSYQARERDHRWLNGRRVFLIGILDPEAKSPEEAVGGEYWNKVYKSIVEHTRLIDDGCQICTT